LRGVDRSGKRKRILGKGDSGYSWYGIGHLL